jgi:hypothetical protein
VKDKMNNIISIVECFTWKTLPSDYSISEVITIKPLLPAHKKTTQACVNSFNLSDIFQWLPQQRLSLRNISQK